MKTVILFAVMLVAFAATSFGQDNVDFGYWNDIQVSKAVNKQVDVIGGVRFNTKRNGSVFSEQRIYTGFNFKSKDGRFTVAPWIVYLKNFGKVPFTEIRPQVTLGYKFTTQKHKVNITPRVRLEYHAKQKLKDDGRIAPVLSIDKKLNAKYAVFQTTEVWFPVGNSKDVAKYRQRYFAGVTRTLNKNVAVDLFYLYQRDMQVAPKHNHALGLTWKFKL